MLLRILTGERRGELLEVPEESTGILGRDAVCDVAIQDPKISRRHCQIASIQGAWCVRDLGSANGTWLDGDRIHQQGLELGSVLKIGDTALEVASLEREEGTAHPVGTPETAVEYASAGGGGDGGWRLGLKFALVGLVVVLGTILASSSIRSWFLPEASDESGPEDARSRSAKQEKTTSSSDTALATRAADPARHLRSAPSASPSDSKEAAPQEEEEGKSPAEMIPARRDGDETGQPPQGPPTPGEEATALARQGAKDEVQRRIIAGDFRGAMQLLRDAEGTTGEPAASSGLADHESGRLARKVLAAAREELSSCVQRGQDLVEAGRYGEAHGIFLDLAGRLPPSLVEPAMKELERLGEAERGRLEDAQSGRERVRIGGALFHEALARLDISSARNTLDELERQAPAGGESSSSLDSWQEDLRDVRLAWGVLVRGVDHLIREATPLRIRWQRGRPRARLGAGGTIAAIEAGPASGEQHLIVGRQGHHIRTSSVPGDQEHLTDVFCLSDATLRELLRRNASEKGTEPAPVASSSSAELTSALGTLLFYREGAERASRFGHARSGGASSGTTPVAAHQPLAPWNLRRKAARRKLDQLLGASTGIPAGEGLGEWSDLCLELADLIVLHSGPRETLESRVLRADYATARGHGLRADLPVDLFHAASVDKDEGRVRLKFDFRTPQQTRALSALGDGASLEPGSRAVMLRGEWRLLDGEPFTDSLAVRLRLHGGPSTAPATAGIALWTSGDATLTPSGTISVMRAMVQGARWWGDSVVFVANLREPLVDYGGEAQSEVYPAGSATGVSLPADVLLIGRRGVALNTQEGECIWARSIGQRSRRGTRTIEVSMERGKAIWRVDGESILPSDPPVTARWLADRQRLGSLRLMTFGTIWHLASLEVEGQLSEDWLDERIRARVQAEVERLIEE